MRFSTIFTFLVIVSHSIVGCATRDIRPPAETLSAIRNERVRTEDSLSKSIGCDSMLILDFGRIAHSLDALEVDFLESHDLDEEKFSQIIGELARKNRQLQDCCPSKEEA